MKNTGYYKNRVTEVIDGNGSTVTSTTNYRANINVTKANVVEYRMIYSSVDHDLLVKGDEILKEMLEMTHILSPSIEIVKTGKNPHLVAVYSVVEPN